MGTSGRDVLLSHCSKPKSHDESTRHSSQAMKQHSHGFFPHCYSCGVKQAGRAILQHPEGILKQEHHR